MKMRMRRLLQTQVDHFKKLAAMGSGAKPAGLKMLLDHIEALEESEEYYRDKIRRMEAALFDAQSTALDLNTAKDRLIDNVAKLQADMTQKTEKVALPQDLAEALDFYHQAHAGASVILRRVESQAEGHNIEIVRRYIRDGKGLEIVRALVNGYTVEEETDVDRMKRKLLAAFDEHGIDCSMPIDRLAELAALVAKEVRGEKQEN